MTTYVCLALPLIINVVHTHRQERRQAQRRNDHDKNSPYPLFVGPTRPRDIHRQQAMQSGSSRRGVSPFRSELVDDGAKQPIAVGAASPSLTACFSFLASTKSASSGSIGDKKDVEAVVPHEQGDGSSYFSIAYKYIASYYFSNNKEGQGSSSSANEIGVQTIARTLEPVQVPQERRFRKSSSPAHTPFQSPIPLSAIPRNISSMSIASRASAATSGQPMSPRLVASPSSRSVFNRTNSEPDLQAHGEDAEFEEVSKLLADMRIHEAQAALKKMSNSANRSGCMDDSQIRLDMMEKEAELEQEIDQRTNDYDLCIDAASGDHCPCGAKWEDISNQPVHDYSCRLFFARDTSNSNVYWYRGVFRIKGSLGRCLVGGDEMELWPEWFSYIDDIPRLVQFHKGVQTMLYYGVSFSIMVYSFVRMVFCEIARYIAPTKRISRAVVEVIRSLDPKDYNLPFKESVPVRTYSLWLPFIPQGCESSDEQETLLIQVASIDMQTSVPEWLATRIMKMVVPTIFGKFKENAVRTREPDDIFYRLYNKDKFGFYKVLDNIHRGPIIGDDTIRQKCFQMAGIAPPVEPKNVTAEPIRIP